jgi:hypothetical protein
MSEKRSMLVAVSAYAGDQHQVEANFPCYRHHGVGVLILSPADAPILQLAGNPEGVYYKSCGTVGWAGANTLTRHAEYLRALLETPYTHYLFHDADSVMLSPRMPRYLLDHPNVFWSNEVQDTNTGASLLPKVALQPPYFFSRAVLERLVEVVDRPAPSYCSPASEGGMPIPTNCIDHYQLQICHAAGVPHFSYPDGRSFETRSDVGLAEMARNVRLNGVVFVHQVKSRPVLDRLILERAAYLVR